MSKKFHFLGICGTAMGAVAAAMVKKGYIVTGSDANVYPPMSTFLESEGIQLFNGYKPENIPADTDIVIVGNSISRGNDEVEEVLNKKLHYMSLPEAMKEHFLRGKHNYIVSGTHGKTTTTSMLAWIMEYAGLNPGFMIGGIAKNLGRGGRFTDSSYTVLEGDEYDTAFFDKRSKFLHYLPEVAIINNIEFDHADIYDNLEQIKKSFSLLVRSVPRNGLVLANADDENVLRVIANPPCPTKTVGLCDSADYIITDVNYTQVGSTFTLRGEAYFIPMVGEFNVRNAAMAICAAQFAGIAPPSIREALKEFQGVARRQEVRGVQDGVTVIDDFAHHPTAIQQAVVGIRQRYPESRVWAVFEPRSNTTRSNVFQNELAIALATADIAIVSNVSPTARVKESDMLDVRKLERDLQALKKTIYLGGDADSISELLSKNAQEGDVILVMSNGGFDGIHQKVLDALALR